MSVVIVGRSRQISQLADWLQSADSPWADAAISTDIVLLEDAKEPNDFTDILPWDDARSVKPQQVIFVVLSRPIDHNLILTWRLRLRGLPLRILLYPWQEPLEFEPLRSWLSECAKDLGAHDGVEPSDNVFTVGSVVRYKAAAQQSERDFAIASFTYSAHLRRILAQLDMARDDYESFLKLELLHSRKFYEDWPIRAARLMTNPGDVQDFAAARRYLNECGLDRVNPSFLPKLLITGPTGTGKTVLARYLSRGLGRSPLPFGKIVITRFLGTEHLFEHEVFGYGDGAYSGSRKGGDPGTLLMNMGGVVLLEEIGDASLTIQAKLLSLFDDLIVEPRGTQIKILCPLLIIATTNHDLERNIENGTFRADLYERFTRRVQLPSLREQSETDFWLILDTLLQHGQVNPDGRIESITIPACDLIKRRLKEEHYHIGQVRQLRNELITAARRARKTGRTWITAADLEQADTSAWQT